MVVIGHLAPGVYRPVKALATLRQDLEPSQTVGIFMVDVFTAVTPGGDMVESAGKLNAQGARHDVLMINDRMLYCKT